MGDSPLSKPSKSERAQGCFRFTAWFVPTGIVLVIFTAADLLSLLNGNLQTFIAIAVSVILIFAVGIFDGLYSRPFPKNKHQPHLGQLFSHAAFFTLTQAFLVVPGTVIAIYFASCLF